LLILQAIQSDWILLGNGSPDALLKDIPATGPVKIENFERLRIQRWRKRA
jgi:hypothetical protein